MIPDVLPRQEWPPVAEAYIEKGVCYAFFAYETAFSIDLDRAEDLIHQTTQRESLPHRRRAPSYFEYQPAPIRVTQPIQPLRIGGLFQTGPTVDLVVYDFGAISVVYSIPIGGPMVKLLPLSDDLYDNQILLGDSRRRVEETLRVIGEAAAEPRIADFVEDYVIFQIETLTPPLAPDDLIAKHPQAIAQILRAEGASLSEQETEDALATKTAFRTDDVAVIDWNAALLVDREGDDIRAVLEFANVELLEMRYLDRKLDLSLDQAYEALSKRSWRRVPMLRSYGADLRRVGEHQAESAILFEGVNNTLKLLGDQYLARVYRLASKRFHLEEWDASILRKLNTLKSIYEMISDQVTDRRMELLEWIIVVLIAVSVLLELLHRMP
ncbi:MAG TPA: hypothetical protein VGH16_10405 [Candidatus Binatia bacterium]|jgi:hypothetical protein